MCLLVKSVGSAFGHSRHRTSVLHTNVNKAFALFVSRHSESTRWKLTTSYHGAKVGTPHQTIANVFAEVATETKVTRVKSRSKINVTSVKTIIYSVF